MSSNLYQINLPINVAGFSKITRGRIHETYEVRDVNNKKYFLKYTDDLVADLRTERYAIMELRKKDIKSKIPKVVYYKFGINKGYILYPYYPNNKIVWENNKYVANFTKNLATFLKNLHSLSVSSKFNNWKENSPVLSRWLDDFESNTRDMVLESQYSEYEDIIKDGCKWIKNQSKSINKSYTHGDIHLSNIIHKKDGSIKKVIDWERLKISDPAYDVMKAEVLILDLYYSLTNYTREKLIKMFRDTYKMSPQFEERVDAYKPMYLLRTTVKTNKRVYEEWLDVGTQEKCIETYEDIFEPVFSNSPY